MISQGLEIFLYVCGAIITVSTAAGVLMRAFKKSVIKSAESTIRENVETVNNEFNETLTRTQAEIHEEIQTLTTLLNEFINKTEINHQLFKHTLMSLARDRINEAYNYYLDKPSIGSHSLAVLEDLFDCYSQLGGNTFTATQMQVLRAKTVVEINKKSK